MEQAAATGRVADRVRRLRRELRWSAQRLAEECAKEGCDSLTRGAIAKIESGARKSVTADEVAVLARVLGVTPTDLVTPTLHRTIVVVDIAGFTRPDRTIVHQRAVHEGLYQVLRDAFAEAGVDWDACVVEDRGDGAMILTPPEVPNSQLVDQLPSRLVTGLRRHNAAHSPEAAMQLRVVFHAGEVYQDERGAVSQAVNLAFRILDAPQAKSALGSSTGMLALLASDTFYRNAIIHDPAADPDSYRQISVPVNEGQAVAWLCRPDHGAPVGSELRQGGLEPTRASAMVWIDDQPRRLLFDRALEARQAAGTPRTPVDSRLHLMIVMEPDGIDPTRYLLSSWRQDDPAQWPPARGETRMVMVDDLERCVDELVVSAERAWSGQADAASLEFVLPRALLNLPVHLWHKEHDSGDPRSLCLEYPVVVRSLERMHSPQWHRMWHQRWQTLMDDPSAERIYFGQPKDLEQRYRLDAILSDPRWALMVLTTPPPRQPQAGTDELAVALRSGLPGVVWHPKASSEALREVVTQLVEDDGLSDLPVRMQTLRQTAFQTPVEGNIARDLVVLWDDPHRLVIFDQLADQAQPEPALVRRRHRG